MLVKDLEHLCSGIPIHVEPSARPLLESGVGNVAPKILDIITAEKRKGLSVKSIELATFTDPEDSARQELVFNVKVEATPDHALEAWDRLSDSVGALRDQLPPLEARLLDEQVCINVEWY